MTPKEFKCTLDALMPSTEDLEEYGLDEVEIADIQNTFRIKERSPNTSKATKSNDALLSLLNDYDCSTLEVGLLRFREARGTVSRGMVFADCEADEVLLSDRGTIILRTAGGHEVMCANNSSRFLSALAAFLQMRKEKTKWQGHARDAAKRCAAIAGGDECEEFFGILCGFLG